MRVVFVGCVEFSRFALKALIDAKADIVGIFTIDDSLKKGVSDFACFDDLIKELNIPIFKFRDFNSKESLQTLESLNPDLMYVIGWSWLVKKQLMDVPKKGVIGLHPTLLPKGRGRAPIPWTILNGLKQSGATIFYINERADAGDILKQISYPIDEDETATTLYKKVCEATYQLVSETYPQLAANKEERLKQDDSLATIWIKRKPSDGLIHWSHSTKDIYTLIRAVTHPYPGAFTFLRGGKIIVWKAKPVLCSKEVFAGSVVVVQNDGVVVATGDGALLLELVQWEGDSEKADSDVLRIGDVFDPLHRVKEIAEKVVQEAKTKRKISMFSVANTANSNNPPVVFPAIRETDTTIAGNVIVISQEQIHQVLEMVDGIVDIILMDAETKVAGWEKAWILFHERVKKSRLLTFKPNDLTVDALDVLLAQTVFPLAGKKIAVIGAGNLGSKIALKLVERGCHVVLTRRDPEKLRKIAEGLNAIKSVHTKSEIHFTVNNCEACREADVVIGATAGTGVITQEMIETMRTPGLIIDAGNGTVLPEALEEAGRRGIRVLCLFMKPAYDGTIKTLFEVQNLIQKMERRCLGDFFILSGGVLGQKGDIIVDDVRRPKRILAIADGCGDVIPNIQEPAFRKNIAVVEALIGGEGE